MGIPAAQFLRAAIELLAVDGKISAQQGKLGPETRNSLGYKDRIKLSNSQSKGHPANFLFEMVTKQAVIFHNHRLDHNEVEATKDVKGVARLVQKDDTYCSSLITAPMRQPFFSPGTARPLGAHGKPKISSFHFLFPYSYIIPI